MNVLDKIIEVKKQEVALKRKQISTDQLTDRPLFNRPVISLSDALKKGTGIIAEYKRKSPSAGEIQDRKIEDVAKFYESQGASAYSVLTDETFFGGKVGDLRTVKNEVQGPVLRKEFIIDEYQIFEAKAYGADAILLISEALDEYHAMYLTTIAKSLDLEVLMEFHSEEEMEKLNENVDVIGVNNRNLKTLKTDLSTSERLMKYLPYNKVKITESGIRSAEDLLKLYSIGFDGCLLGESVLKDVNLLPELVAAANNSKLLIQ
jgi:indole-3-glycerol phosphate synthase